MELWVSITLVAAFLQNGRTALQRKLTDRLTSDEASYVRFCFAVPFALAYVGLLVALGNTLPGLHWTFAGIVVVGAIGQIFGTVALLRAFNYRNFTVGTAYSKTETVQTALFGLVLLGEFVSLYATVGILVSLAGVLLLSSPSGLKEAFRGGLGPAAWLGMGAGAGFAFSAVCFRAASLSLDGPFFVTAAVTVLASTTIQTVLMGGYLYLRDDKSLLRVAGTWRWGAPVGLLGMAASTCWFTAMTLERAAYVRALGQIELLFAFVVTGFMFGEHVTRREIGGSLLVVFGILLILML